MKILLIGSYYPSMGGAERALHELCISLKKEGIKFSILTPGINGKIPKGSFKTEKSWTLMKDYGKIQKKGFLEYVMNYSSLVPGIFLGKKIMNKRKIDVIHAHFGLSHGMIGVFLKKIYNKPLVLTLHGGGFNFKGWRKIFRPFTKIVLNSSDAIIAVSKSMKEKAKSETSGEIKVIPNSVFVDEFKNKGEEFVLSVGRLVELKDFDTLIRAAADKKISGEKFVIIGDGPEKENLTKLIYSLKISDFSLLGYMSHEETKDILSRCSVFCLPSKSEGMPLTILEAMACSKPIIGTRVGGIPEVIRDGKNGFIIEEGDHKRLSYFLQKILSDKSLRKRMGKISRQRVLREFNWSKNIKKIKEIYLRVSRK